MLMTPLSPKTTPRMLNAVLLWFLTFGFSLTFGSTFAKLFRLYKICTSRSLIVPRLSNIKLFYIVVAFLSLDFVLLLICNIVAPPRTEIFSVFSLSEADLVTGHRQLTWKMCTFSRFCDCCCFVSLQTSDCDRWRVHGSFGSGLLFFLTWSFFVEGSYVYCGIWIVFITMMALTLDSNLLLACREFSQPLRKMLNTKDSKDKARAGSLSKTGSLTKTRSKDDSGTKRSHDFCCQQRYVSRKILGIWKRALEELNFQRTAVRRALQSANASSPNTELSDIAERRSTRNETPKYRTPSMQRTCSNLHIDDVIKNSTMDCNCSWGFSKPRGCLWSFVFDRMSGLCTCRSL